MKIKGSTTIPMRSRPKRVEKESYNIIIVNDIVCTSVERQRRQKVANSIATKQVEGAQKMSKVYGELMKSGKWTAAQNKKEEEEGIDSIGAIVAICETDGFIPRYYVEGPQDKVDRVIQDMQIYTRQLVVEELGLGNLIENSLKSLQKEQESIEAAGDYAEHLSGTEEDKLFNYSDSPITYEDYKEFSEFEENWEKDSVLNFEEE